MKEQKGRKGISMHRNVEESERGRERRARKMSITGEITVIVVELRAAASHGTCTCIARLQDCSFHREEDHSPLLHQPTSILLTWTSPAVMSRSVTHAATCPQQKRERKACLSVIICNTCHVLVSRTVQHSVPDALAVSASHCARQGRCCTVLSLSHATRGEQQEKRCSL